VGCPLLVLPGTLGAQVITLSLLLPQHGVVAAQVDIRADKKKIKKAVQGLYDIQTKKINTLIR
jgi:ribosomal protein L23